MNLVKKHNVFMAQISLAWLFKKGIAFTIDASKSVDLELTDEDIEYLEALFICALPEDK